MADARLDTLELVTAGISARATQPVVASLRNRILEFTTVQVEGNGVTASASGRVGLDATAPIDAHLVFDADLAQTPHPADLTVTGTAHGDITLNGTRERPRAFGEVALSGITAQRSGQTIVTLEDGRLDLQGDVAVVQNIRANGGRRRRRADGQHPGGGAAARRPRRELRPHDGRRGRPQPALAGRAGGGPLRAAAARPLTRPGDARPATRVSRAPRDPGATPTAN